MQIVLHLTTSFVMFVATAACNSDRAVSRSIGASVKSGPGHRIVLAEHAPFAWERVCIFGPYTMDKELAQITGVPDAAKWSHDINHRDDISVMMFVEDRRITRSIPLHRANGDFAPDLVRRCFSRGQAVFAVRTPPNGGWGNIGAVPGSESGDDAPASRAW